MLSIDDVYRRAPSVFADSPADSRSDKYTFIPTHAIMGALMEEGWEVSKAYEKRTLSEDRIGKTKHMLRFRPSSSLGIKDLIVGDTFPEVVLTNSHDGSSAYKINAGLFRLVCLNGMTVADTTVEQRTIRHSGNALDDVIEGVYEIIQEMPKVQNMVEIMKDIPLEKEEQLLLGEVALDLRYGREVFDEELGIHLHEVNTLIKPSEILMYRREKDKSNDMWTTFNVIQENIIKGAHFGRGLNRNRTGYSQRVVKPITGIDKDMQLNKALWAMAEKFIELKTS